MELKPFYPTISDNLPKHIKKGHQLVFSRQDLSAREADLFALMVANMNVEDWESSTPRYRFKASQLSEWLGVDSKHVGSNLKPVADRLSSRKIGIKVSDNTNGDEEFDFRPLFKNITYKNGVLTMVPNDMLRQEYIEYQQGFALINTQNFLELKKEYSKRLYELLSRFKSSGTTMHSQSIDVLKGLFGLLDENGKLKKDKQSFKNTGVFMKRCIRDSIEELVSHPQTKKELLFFEGPSGFLGYEPVKRGRSIVALDFQYRFINKGTVQELNTQDAKENIRTLELKRLQTQTPLSIEELRLLSTSYQIIGREDKSIQIEKSIAKREEEQHTTEEDNSFDAVLERISELENLSDNPDY